MDLIKIGKYIAGKRKSLGMTQKQLAEKLGMSDKSVSKWERGVCLPDVSVYKELCSILGISLNEFLAGEDIAQENMIQKSETNIIEVIRDNIDKQKCLKVMKCILLVISICAVSVIGFTIYRLKKPQNYISPVAKDSIEMQTAELLAGPDGAFVYKFITTDEYKKLRLHIYRYESGKLSDQDKVEMGFEDIGSPKSGEIVMVPDFDNYVIKLIISGGGSRLSTEIPVLENVENREYYGRTATEIKNVVDIRYDKQQPLIAFVYDNDEMSVPTLDDFINSQTDFLSKNDYAGIIRFKGQLMTYVPGEGPCYRCVFKNPPPKDAVPTCKQAGVIGAMGGVIGSLQAMEAIKYLIGVGDLLTGYLLTFDALTMEFHKVKLPKDTHDCAVCGDHPTILEPIDYEQEVCEETAGRFATRDEQ